MKTTLGLESKMGTTFIIRCLFLLLLSSHLPVHAHTLLQTDFSEGIPLGWQVIIGAFLFDQAQLYIESWGYQAAFETATRWFQEWGFWAVLVAGFSPIPYKVFTISAGVLQLALLPFVLASIIGRGARFFLVAWCLAKFGPAIEPKLMRHIETVGWITVALLVAAILYYYVGPG